MRVIKKIPYKRIIAIVAIWLVIMGVGTYAVMHFQYNPETREIVYVQGQEGDRGSKGDKGDKGDTGDTGSTGPTGEDAINSADYVIYHNSAGNVVADASESSGLADLTGTTDARPTIQTALDNVESNGGGSVFIKTGTFLLKSNVTVAGVGGGWDAYVCLRIPSDVSLIGSGDSTILKQDSDVNAHILITNKNWQAGDVWENQIDSNILISALKIDGNILNQDYTGFAANHPKATGIFFNCEYSKIEGIYATHCGMYGAIWLYSAYTVVENCVIENTTFLTGDYSSEYACGIFLSSVESDMNVLRGITVRDVDGTGIFVEDNVNSTIISDFNIYNASWGINTSGAYKTEISAGIISNCKSGGIYLHGDDHSVSGVDIDYCEGNGITVSTGKAIISECIIANNVQTPDSNGGGIMVSGSATRVIIDSCDIYDDQAVHTQSGIHSWALVIITGCFVTNALAHGIFLHNGADNSTLSDSTVQGSGGYGILIEAGADYIIITENHCIDNTLGGIQNNGLNNIVNNNLTS